MGIQIKIVELSDERKQLPIPWTTGLVKRDSRADISIYRIDHYDHLPKDEDFPLIEYIISPYSKDTWRDVWSINMIVADRLGILGRISTFLRDLKINILSMNGASLPANHFDTDLDKFHSLRLVIDGKKYRPQKEISFGRLDQLQRELIVEFIDDIYIPDANSPYVYVRRLTTASWASALANQNKLYKLKAKNNFASNAIRSEDSDDLSDYFGFRLAEDEIEHIKRIYDSQIKSEAIKEAKVHALISSDARSDMIQVFPYIGGFAITHIIVSVDNKPGAISALSACLARNNFNIIGSKVWSSQDEAKTIVWVLVKDESLKKMNGQQNSEDTIKRKLAKLISNGDKTLRTFNAEIKERI